MAETITVSIDGLRDLGERMRVLSSDVSLKISRAATNAAAQVIKKQAIHNLESNPTVDTGLLKSNVVVKRIPKGKTALTSEHVVTIRKRDYPGSKARRNTRQVAMYMEFGTVKLPPGRESFLGPAFRQRGDDAMREMIDRLKSRIEKAGG